MVIALLIPFFALIIGVVKINECPVNDMIPVYLIAVGLIGVISSSLNLGRQCSGPDDVKKQRCLACAQCPLSFLWLGFFIAGNIWVYGSLSRVETGEEDKMVISPEGHPVPNPHYCHPWVFWLAFFMITIVYVMLTVLCCIVCAIGVYVTKQSGEQIPLNDMNNQSSSGGTYTEGTRQATPQATQGTPQAAEEGQNPA